MCLVTLEFLLPCSSVLGIVSAERKKQRSISNPIKNNWPNSQSHLLSAGIPLIFSQHPSSSHQISPVRPERRATGTAIWQRAVRKSLVSITDGIPWLSWRLNKWLTDACRDGTVSEISDSRSRCLKHFNKCLNIYFNYLLWEFVIDVPTLASFVKLKKVKLSDLKFYLLLFC